MERSEIEAVLNELLISHKHRLGPEQSKSLLKQDPYESDTDSFILTDAYERCLQAIQRCGRLLECEHVIQCFAGVIMSGTLKNVPVLIAAVVDDDRAYLKTLAKEGLISQHSATKALQQFRGAL